MNQKVELAEKLETFKQGYRRRQIGDDYKMMAPWIEELSFMASMETLPEGTRPLMHMLFAASKGITTHEVDSAPIGNGLSRVYDGITKAILSVAFVKPTPGAKLFLEKIIPVLFTSLIVGVTLLSKEGVGKQVEGKYDSEELKQFSFEILLHMLAKSGALQDLFVILLESAGALDEKKEIASEILVLFTEVLILEVAINCGGLNSERLLESMRKNVLKSIETVNNFLDEELAIKRIENDDATHLNIALGQTKLNFTTGDVSNFSEGLSSALKVANVSYNEWKEDLKRVEKYSLKILALLKSGSQSDINDITGFYQAG